MQGQLVRICTYDAILGNNTPFYCIARRIPVSTQEPSNAAPVEFVLWSDNLVARIYVGTLHCLPYYFPFSSLSVRSRPLEEILLS